MNKNIIVLLSGLILVNAAIVHAGDDAAESQYVTSEQEANNNSSYFNRFLKFVGGITSGAAGVVIAKKWTDYCASEAAQWTIHYDKAIEHYNDWVIKTHSDSEFITRFASILRRGLEKEMPKDHPYFLEMDQARSHRLGGDAVTIPYLLSALLIIGSGILLYQCFTSQNNEQEKQIERM
jgi:hypothetical protein